MSESSEQELRYRWDLLRAAYAQRGDQAVAVTPVRVVMAAAQAAMDADPLPAAIRADAIAMARAMARDAAARLLLLVADQPLPSQLVWLPSRISPLLAAIRQALAALSPQAEERLAIVAHCGRVEIHACWIVPDGWRTPPAPDVLHRRIVSLVTSGTGIAPDAICACVTNWTPIVGVRRPRVGIALLEADEESEGVA